MPMREFTVSEQSGLRSMIAARQHPDRIEAYLAERGYSPAEMEDVFSKFNVRRPHLLTCYRMMRNLRIIGGLLILGSVSSPVFNSPGTVILVSLGLLVYGVAWQSPVHSPCTNCMAHFRNNTTSDRNPQGPGAQSSPGVCPRFCRARTSRQCRVFHATGDNTSERATS